ncbi:hypothetical protein LTR10_012880 [Elasticomyces elasticus]|nr:hypothetical protein LTR10_012880 [Elasticomyces elasticus]KAK4978698.1 hypothetical protein LTR42_001198 [Elasticomyces elasticus]
MAFSIDIIVAAALIIPSVETTHPIARATVERHRPRNLSFQGQTNICLATQPNIIENVSIAQLQERYTSLSSANPSATTFVFDATALAVLATSTSSIPTTSLTSTTSSTSLMSSSTSASVPTTTNPVSDQLVEHHTSGGVIAGAVVAGIAGLALVAGVVYLISRRRRSKSRTDLTEGSRGTIPSKTVDGGFPGYQQMREEEAAPGYMLAEMESSLPAHRSPVELSSVRAYSELDGTVPTELPGAAGPAKPSRWG